MWVSSSMRPTASGSSTMIKAACCLKATIVLLGAFTKQLWPRLCSLGIHILNWDFQHQNVNTALQSRYLNHNITSLTVFAKTILELNGTVVAEQHCSSSKGELVLNCIKS